MRKRVVAYVDGRSMADEPLEVGNDDGDAVERAKAKLATRLDAGEQARAQYHLEEY